MARKFYTLDVFTKTALTGNPLAVVLDSNGLDGDAMQAIASEFNLSETVFVSPPRKHEIGASIRIFTPVHELPFAGHPTVGTAILLNHLNHLGCSDEFVLEEKVGPVRCVVSGDAGDKRARFDLPKVSDVIDTDADITRITDALSLKNVDIDLDMGGISYWDGGVPYMLVPVTTLEAVRRANADAAKLGKVEPVLRGISANPYVFCRGGVEDDADIHARMFAPNFGIPEDPATGSAVASLSGLLAEKLMDTNESRSFIIEQGFEMGRPSRIHLDMEKKDGETVSAGISGSAVIVSEGELHI